jgi:hypothetical protein
MCVDSSAHDVGSQATERTIDIFACSARQVMLEVAPWCRRCSYVQMLQNVLFGRGALERKSEYAIKQMCATNRCVADRQLFRYNFNDSVAVF